MSRIGKQPVPIGAGVTAKVAGSLLTVQGPKGSLERRLDPRISAAVDKGAIRFTRTEDTRQARALHGLYRALAANMCEGVTKGYAKSLEVVGVGYAVKVEGKYLVLTVGFCKPVKVEIPKGLTVTCPTATLITVTGIDNQQVGDYAARIRKVRPPEPYNGKGIRFQGEAIRRKASKSAAGK